MIRFLPVEIARVQTLAGAVLSVTHVAVVRTWVHESASQAFGDHQPEKVSNLLIGSV